MWRTARKSQGKCFPDNSPAITRSLKTPPGSHVNTPARHAAQQHGANPGRAAAPYARTRKAGSRQESYLSMITGSEGVSFLFPQLFLSQHRLEEKNTEREKEKTRHEIWENQQTACMCLSSSSTVCLDLFIWHALFLANRRGVWRRFWLSPMVLVAAVLADAGGG